MFNEFKRWAKGQFSGQRKDFRRFARPSVEPLDDRIVLASLSWTGNGATPLVSDPMNWSTLTAPGPGDDLLFNGVNGPNRTKPATFDIPAVSSVSIMSIYGAAITFNNDVAISSFFDDQGSDLSIPSGNTVSANSLVLGTVSGDLSVSGGGLLYQVGQGGQGWTVGSSTVAFSGGTNLVVGQGTQFSLTSALSLSAGSTWNNYGTVTWGANPINDAGTIINYGSFNIVGDGTMDSGGVFNNFATVTKTAGGNSVTNFSVTFNNLVPPNGGANPSVNVNVGQLWFGWGGDNTASYTVGLGGVIDFQSQLLPAASYTMHTGTTFAGGWMGAGTVEFSLGAQIILPAGETMQSNVGPTVDMSGFATTITGGTFTSNGTFIWEGGTINSTLVNANGPVAIGGASTMTLTNAAMMLRGETVWGPNTRDLVMNSSVIDNLSTFTVQNDATIQDPFGTSKFTNDVGGTFTKTAGIGGNSINPQFVNQGDLLLNGFSLSFTQIEQTKGSTQLAGGTLSIIFGGNPGDFVLNGGVFTGAGSVNGNLDNNSGEVNFSTSWDILRINGIYTQNNFIATLSINYDACSGDYDQLIVNGTAQLGGVLNLILPSGDPPQNTSFTVVAAVGYINGTFSTTPGGYTTSYTASTVIVTKN